MTHYNESLSPASWYAFITNLSLALCLSSTDWLNLILYTQHTPSILSDASRGISTTSQQLIFTNVSNLIPTSFTTDNRATVTNGERSVLFSICWLREIGVKKCNWQSTCSGQCLQPWSDIQPYIAAAKVSSDQQLFGTIFIASSKSKRNHAVTHANGRTLEIKASLAFKSSVSIDVHKCWLRDRL